MDGKIYRINEEVEVEGGGNKKTLKRENNKNVEKGKGKN